MNSHLASSFTLKENNIPPFLIVQTPQKRAVGTHFDSSRVSDSPSSSTPFPNFVFYFFHLFPSPPSSHYLHALQLQFISTFQIWVGVHLLFHSLLFFSLTLCLCISFPRSLSLSLSLSTQVSFHRFPYYSCYTPDCFPSFSPWYLLSIPALHPIIFLLPSSLPSHPQVKPPEFLFSSFFPPLPAFSSSSPPSPSPPFFIFLRSTLFSLANRFSRRLT